MEDGWTHRRRRTSDLPVDHVPAIRRRRRRRPSPARPASPTTTARSSSDLSVDDPDRQDHRDRRPQRLRQVDAAAGARPPAQAEARHGAARRHARSTSCRRARSPPSSASCRSRPSPPRASPSPTSSAAAATRTRAGSGSGRAADRAAVDGALEATGTLDLAGRPVDELSGGQRQRVWIAMTLAQGTGADAARRADDVPRPRPPGRGARPARRPQPARGPHDRARPPRPQPRLPLRPPPDRHARRGDRRRGLARRHRHRRAGHRRVRAALPGHRRPGVADADGRADRPPPPRVDEADHRSRSRRERPHPTADVGADCVIAT